MEIGPRLLGVGLDHGRAGAPTGKVRNWRFPTVKGQWNKQPWYFCAGRATTALTWQVAGVWLGSASIKGE